MNTRSVCSFDPDECFKKPRRHRSSSVAFSVIATEEDQDIKPSKSAFSRIIQLCSVRDRSEAEMKVRLHRDGYESQDIIDSIARARDCGILDDSRFAEAYIRTKVASGKGRQLIVKELKKYGIQAESIPGWPDEFGIGEDDQLEIAVAFLKSHPPRAKDKWGSAYRKLAQKGFSGSVCSQATRIWFDQYIS